MSKYRHRTFEMYEYREEAICALTPKSMETDKPTPDAPLSSDFSYMTVSRSAAVTHVQLKGAIDSSAESEGQFSEDLCRLADMLTIDSKVLLDFTDVESFSTAGIDALTLFNRKLRHRGSRVVLCSLNPDTRASFFPAR